MNQRFKQGIILLIGVVSLIIFIYYSGIASYFTLSALKQESALLKIAVQNHYFKSVLIFVISYIVLIALTLPITGPMTLLGGYLFGVLGGFVYSLFGAVFGSTVSFLLIRYVLGSIMRQRYKDKLESFQEKMKHHGFSYLLMLHLLSIFPFVVVNTLAALTNVSVVTSFLTTLIGSIPLIFIYAWAGQQLGTISSMRDIFSPQLFIIFGLLALLALLPIILKRFKQGPEI